MKRARSLAIEWVVLLYFLSYLPYIVITRLVTSTPNQTLGRPPSGLETLPGPLLISLVLTYLFIWLSGWHRDANALQLGGIRLPVPTRYTLLSGVGTALILFTVPLSLTFANVSIPFIQLLMRGDVLIIAPLVDLMFRRRVRWWSWGALLLVAGALFLVIRQRGGLKLPPLALLTVVLYTIGYFIRLAVMTRVAKSSDPASVRRYFTEEKIVALPLAVLCLVLLSASGFGSQASQLGWGFIDIWTDPVIWPLLGLGVTLTIVSVFAAMVLLDPRENTFCVPLERSSSLLAGIVGTYLLHWGWSMPAPTGMEVVGAVLLIAAILLLTIAPHYARQGPRG
jgi:drug/metabolite transporter (DMT)-like permease